MEAKMRENEIDITDYRLAAEKHRHAHNMFVKSLGQPRDNYCPELMQQFLARNAAKAIEAMQQCEAAFKMREGENEELLMAITQRRMSEMKVDAWVHANLKNNSEVDDRSNGL